MAKGNNFGLRTRDLGKAGTFALNAAATHRDVSYSTAATVGERWQQFTQHAKENGIKRLEGVSGSVVIEYAQGLAEKVEAGELSAGYAQNLVSAVNKVMDLATKGRWNSVSPTQAGGIPPRTQVRTQVPQGLDHSAVESATDAMRAAGNERGAAVVELANELGLRSKEASMLDARSARQEANQDGVITITHGTKGGRLRQIPLSSMSQMDALARAIDAQGEARNLIPPSLTWAQWREGGLRQARQTLQAHGVSRIHELRSAYAFRRYRQITRGHKPAMAGGKASKAQDRAARLQISRELGHSRVSISVSYLGSMK